MGTKFEIVWSKESKLQFDKIISYLKCEWTEREALKFNQELREFEMDVCLFSELFAESRKKTGFRLAVITKHNSVVYKIDKKKVLILVFTIFDNRQNLNKL